MICRKLTPVRKLKKYNRTTNNSMNRSIILNKSSCLCNIFHLNKRLVLFHLTLKRQPHAQMAYRVDQVLLLWCQGGEIVHVILLRVLVPRLHELFWRSCHFVHILLFLFCYKLLFVDIVFLEHQRREERGGRMIGWTKD